MNRVHDDVVKKIKHGDYTIEVICDEDPINPREWDNLGKMICFHRRYRLGDDHNYDNPQDAIEGLWREYASEDEKRRFILKCFKGKELSFWRDLINNRNSIDEIFEYTIDEYYGHGCKIEDYPEDLICTNLYLYDHSGITISGSKFSCSWDSGQVGFIYVSKKDAIKEYGDVPDLIERAQKVIDIEIETYDDYITGSVYGYKVKDANGNHIDSCWGFYGYDHEKSGLLEQSMSKIEYDKKAKQKEKEEAADWAYRM